MFFLLRLPVLSRKVCVALCFLVAAIFTMGNAQAITIDFDELDLADFSDLEAGMRIPLSNEYEAKGVIFTGAAYLLNYSTKSAPNYINGPGFGIHFLNILPTHVSMYVGSTVDYKVRIRAIGGSGYVEDKTTDGYVHGMHLEESTPYRPNQFVSFYVPEGISHIEFGGQADAYLDDLSFTVTEPATWILFVFSGLILLLRRRPY